MPDLIQLEVLQDVSIIATTLTFERNSRNNQVNSLERRHTVGLFHLAPG